MMTLYFSNDVANDAKSTQKSMITSYLLVGKVNQLGKLIKRGFASFDIKFTRLTI